MLVYTAGFGQKWAVTNKQSKKDNHAKRTDQVLKHRELL